MKRFVLLACALGAAACGDNKAADHDHDIDDAQQIDAQAIDAQPTDAATDAAVATHSGTISVFEVTLRNMGGAGVDGRGIQVGIGFTANANVNAPVMEESPSPIDGCKLWEYTPVQLAATLGADEGPVQITATDGSPLFPPCVYAGATTGYICPDSGSSGVGGQLTMVTAGTTAFTITGGTATFGAEDVGRYLKLNATGVGALDTAFPIVNVQNATTAVIAGAGITLTLPAAATFTTLAGVGPTPGVPSPGFMADNEQLTFAKTAGTNFNAFPANLGFTGAGGVGDDFTLGTMNGKVLPTAIPTNGSAFTIGCDDAAGCGTALGSILNIVTTDGVLGTSPFSFPPPATKRVQIRCIKVGATTITVPAAYSARLQRAMSGANRIQATFIRANQAGTTNTTGAPNQALIAGGHGEVGFTTVP